MTGKDRFAFRSCACVVIGSALIVSREYALFRPRRLGVDGCEGGWKDGVHGVGMLEMDDCVEWPPMRDCGRR